MTAIVGTAGAALLVWQWRPLGQLVAGPVPGFLARALVLSVFQLAMVVASVPLWRRLLGDRHLLDVWR